MPFSLCGGGRPRPPQSGHAVSRNDRDGSRMLKRYSILLAPQVTKFCYILKSMRQATDASHFQLKRVSGTKAESGIPRRVNCRKQANSMPY